MSISKADVESVAHLAHLRLSEDEIAELQEDIEAILDYVGRLDELDVDEEPPLFNPADLSENVWRDDEVRDAGVAGTFLAGVPEVADGHPRVPRVVGGSGEGER